MTKHTPDLKKQITELESVIKAVEMQLDDMLAQLPQVQEVSHSVAQRYLLHMMDIAEGRDHLRDALDTLHSVRLSQDAAERKPSAIISNITKLHAELLEYTESASTTDDIMLIIMQYV